MNQKIGTIKLFAASHYGKAQQIRVAGRTQCGSTTIVQQKNPNVITQNHNTRTTKQKRLTITISTTIIIIWLQLKMIQGCQNFSYPENVLNHNIIS